MDQMHLGLPTLAGRIPPRGVALQVYLALIAALLLQNRTGHRPGKRAMEMIRFYLVGYADLDELCATLRIEKNQA